ncbi:hypothetical protein GCM10010415_32530 [Streptomyces atrovirens]
MAAASDASRSTAASVVLSTTASSPSVAREADEDTVPAARGCAHEVMYIAPAAVPHPTAARARARESRARRRDRRARRRRRGLLEESMAAMVEAVAVRTVGRS